MPKPKPLKKLHNKFKKPIDLDNLIYKHRRAIQTNDKFNLDIYISLWKQYPNQGKAALKRVGITLESLKDAVSKINEPQPHS